MISNGVLFIIQFAIFDDLTLLLSGTKFSHDVLVVIAFCLSRIRQSVLIQGVKTGI